MARSVEQQFRDLIVSEDYAIVRIVRILDEDCDGDREALFRGRYRGDPNAKIPAEKDEACYRAVLRGDGTGFVVVGW